MNVTFRDPADEFVLELKDAYLQKVLEVTLAQRVIFHQGVDSVSQCEALSNFLSFPILLQL